MLLRWLLCPWLFPVLLAAQVVPGTSSVFDLKQGRLFHRPPPPEPALAPKAALALGDFTLACIMEWKDLGEDQVIVEAGEKGSSCRLLLTKDRCARFELKTDSGATTILSGPVLPQEHWRLTVVVSVKRDPRQAVSGIWINGVEVASAAVPPGALHFLAPVPRQDEGGSEKGTVVRVMDVYDHALDRSEILDWHGDGLGLEIKSLAQFVAVGGTEAVSLLEDGTFEALALGNDALSPQNKSDPFATTSHMKMYSLTWETDTVFRQDRPLNFGSLEQQLQRAEAHMVMLFFGRQECLERGEEGLPDFRKALAEMVARCKTQAQAVALAGSVPFESQQPPLPDRSALNPVLKKYQQVMDEVARDAKIQFFDVFDAWPKDATGFTTDGVQLSTRGSRLYAEVLYRQLFKAAPSVPAESDVMQVADKLRPLIHAKNKLWHEYWRPSNWAFLYGDRTAQPSSRDHLNPQVRWFPKELDKYRQLIRQKEEEIWKQAEELRRKVP